MFLGGEVTGQAAAVMHGQSRLSMPAPSECLHSGLVATTSRVSHRRCGRLKNAPDDDSVRIDDVVILIAPSAGANSLSFSK